MKAQVRQGFAGALQRFLRDQGLSIEQAAAKAGLAPSTLRRWEKEGKQPRMSSLNLLMRALAASREEEERLLRHVDAPRAVAARRANVPPSDDLHTYMPSVGDLWRAMRERAELTGRQVADALRVDAGRVSKWEHATLAVSEERLDELFALLRATPEERAHLSQRRLLLTPPIPAQEMTLEPCEALLRHYYAVRQNNVLALSDLALITLEMQLWALLPRYGQAWFLVAEAWTLHADYLLWQRRFTGARRYADRARLAYQQKRLPCGHNYLWAAQLSARCCVAARAPAPERRSEVTGAAPQGYRQALGLLEMEHIPLIKNTDTSSLYRDRATYLGELGEIEAAQSSLQRSRRETQRHASAAYCRADFVEGRLLVRAGRAREGLPLLQRSAGAPTNMQVLDTYMLTQACLALGERREAEQYFTQLHDIVLRQGYAHEGWRVRELERHF